MARPASRGGAAPRPRRRATRAHLHCGRARPDARSMPCVAPPARPGACARAPTRSSARAGRCRRRATPSSARTPGRCSKDGTLVMGRESHDLPIVRKFKGDTGRILIGNFVTIGPGVEFHCGGLHRTEWVSQYGLRAMLALPGAYEDGFPHGRGDIHVGGDAWFGQGAVITTGVTIGRGRRRRDARGRRRATSRRTRSSAACRRRSSAGASTTSRSPRCCGSPGGTGRRRRSARGSTSSRTRTSTRSSRATTPVRGGWGELGPLSRHVSAHPPVAGARRDRERRRGRHRQLQRRAAAARLPRRAARADARARRGARRRQRLARRLDRAAARPSPAASACSSCTATSASRAARTAASRRRARRGSAC